MITKSSILLLDFPLQFTDIGVGMYGYLKYNRAAVDSTPKCASLCAIHQV